jgi:hypothetical protein
LNKQPTRAFAICLKRVPSPSPPSEAASGDEAGKAGADDGAGGVEQWGGEEAVIAAAVPVNPDYLSPIVDAGDEGATSRQRIVKGGIDAAAVNIPMIGISICRIISDDLPLVVDPMGDRGDGRWKI